jgi:hypothetical protein
MNTTRKCIEKKANQKGTVFALVVNDAAYQSFSVLKLCENYDGKVRGGIRKTWRTVLASANEAAARELFTRRIAGTQR